MAFSYYKAAATNHNQCGTVNSIDWPLQIAVIDADLKMVSNGGFVQSTSGFDIRPFADAALTVPLTYELVTYIPATGQLEMYVKLPILSVTADIVVYLAFGNAALITDGSLNSTWDAGFVGVYHFGNGTPANLLTDSSQKANHATNGGATVGTGTSGGAAVLTRAQYIDIPGLANYFGNKPAITMSLALNPGATANGDVISTIGQLDFSFGVTTTSPYYRLGLTLRDGVHGGLSPVCETGDNGYTEGVWQRLAAVVDGAADKQAMWRDGGVIASSTAVFDTFDPAAANFVRIGFNTAATCPGTYDEVRFSDVVRSPSWLIADWNNQKPGSTFLSWSAKAPVAGGVAVEKTQTFIMVPV